MHQSFYRIIPNTSDALYWTIRRVPNALRSTTFVPRDKALHPRLKLVAWVIIQASLPRKRRKGHS